MARPNRWLFLMTCLFCLGMFFGEVQGAEFRNTWTKLGEGYFLGGNSAVVFRDQFWMAWNDSWGEGLFMNSSDGKAWKAVSHPPSVSSLVVLNDALWVDQPSWIEYQTDRAYSRCILRTQDGITWTTVTTRVPALAEPQLLAFQGKLWMTGYRQSWDLPSRANELWRLSDDATTWTQTTANAPWGFEVGFGAVEFNNRLWIMGGADLRHNYGELSHFNDVWYTTDGTSWTLATPHAAWSPRSRFSTFVYDGKLWLVGGETYYADDYDYGEEGSSSSEIWSTRNGVNWSQEPGTSLWSPRHNHSTVVKDGRVYLIGGISWNPDGTPIGPQEWKTEDSWMTADPLHDAVAVSGLNYALKRRAANQIQLTVKNTGKTPWAGSKGYRLELKDDPARVWAGTQKFIAVPAGATVQPGQTITFTIPIDNSRVFHPCLLKLQMFQPDVLNFGDLFQLTLQIVPDAPLAWYKIKNPQGYNLNRERDYFYDSEMDRWGSIAAFNGRMRLGELSSSDGIHWSRSQPLPLTSWEAPHKSSFFALQNKLWMVGAYHEGFSDTDGDHSDLWNSEDGVNWNRVTASPPWKTGDLRYLVEFQNKLWAYGGIYLDFWIPEYDQGIYNSSAGSSWRKVATDQTFYASSPIVEFQSRLWRFGGGYWSYNQAFEYFDWIPETSTDCTTNGLTWKASMPLPEPRADHVVLTYHNKVWMLGGIDQGDEYDGRAIDAIWYSSDGLTWAPSNPAPWGAFAKWKGLVFDDKIWLFGPDGQIWWGHDKQVSATVEEDAVDFGMRDIFAGRSPVRTVTLTNTGLAPLTLTGAGAALSGAGKSSFLITQGLGTTPLAPGEARAVKLAFDPNRVGPVSATLTITTADPAHPSVQVKLTGSGSARQPQGTADLLAYLLGLHADATGLDLNADGKVNIADLVPRTHGLLRVNSPAPGTNWMLQTKHDIAWTADAKAGATVNIDLYKNHRFNQSIARSVSNSGKFTWTISGRIIPGGDYTVAVSSAGKPGIASESAGYFSLAAVGGLTVQQPYGGERWARGSRQVICWIKSENLDDEVKLGLYRDAQYVQTISSGAANDGYYTWTVPSDLPTGEGYQIVVVDGANDALRDASDGAFAIIAAP